MENSVQVIKGGLAVVGGVVAGLMGGFDNLLRFYIALIVVDFLLGCAKGVKTKNFSSAIALWGFINKVIALAMICLCFLLDGVLDKAFFLRNISIIWFSICEGASILENLAIIGVPFPDGVREVLVQAQKGFSINFSQIVGQIVKNYKFPEGEDSNESKTDSSDQ